VVQLFHSPQNRKNLTPPDSSHQLIINLEVHSAPNLSVELGPTSKEADTAYYKRTSKEADTVYYKRIYIALTPSYRVIASK
jgi:hypothetical protein